MRIALLFTLTLAGCGASGDRLADGQPGPIPDAAIAAPISLVKTSWIVAAINERATPGGIGYFLKFGESEISARFGCNSIGGTWRLNGDHVSTTDLMQTEMGCPEPAASFERLGSAVLGSNMRIEREGGEAMRLISEAGSIDLKRAM